ncbi:cytochrome c oxidase subunit II [Limnoglobus roseus]|uniref:Cytochrome c oxidase subunit 2 n=1 Tax=Limnoglobus roseus TaxID=2598579 RepID=A0A5C1A9G6_9BACT|nr:cytochrome c oxidase subunit II [Limnoglobus roseus]QEL15370.1 cytochrome c oxidase subunit II [Limnoglobus roseus]
MLLAEGLGLPLWPERGTQFAIDYDWLFIYILVVTTAAGLLVYAGLTFLCFKYAKKPGGKSARILGSHKLELLWTIIPTAFFLSFFVFGLPIFDAATHPPADAPEIFVVGKQWMWKIQHPNGVREINELHLQQDVAVKVTGTSEDVIHDFGIPAFRNKIDVVPGRYVTTWYKPTKVTKAGEPYHIFCDQYCGQGHSQMVGKVHVLSREDYQDWLAGHKTDNAGAPGDRPTDGTAAWHGQQLFFKMQCINCHNNVYDADSVNSSNRAPNLEGLFGSQVPVEGGKTVPADGSYIRESIRNPMAKVHVGWKPIMPAFPRAQLSEEELGQLVAYIQYLKKGKLPKRTSQDAAPVGAPTQGPSLGEGSPAVPPPPAPKNPNPPAPAPTPKGAN